MDNLLHQPPEHCNVAIVGGGPAGLATATELTRLGITDVVVLERESQAGGIPRHCGHSPFGIHEFKRCYTGPQYAQHLVKRVQRSNVALHVNTTVVSADRGGELTLTTAHGIIQLKANIVVLSTGVRETPRAARLVSGQRPLGIVTTGALQSMVYLKKQIPFAQPIIIGTELVSLSALLTCRHANIKPVAMLEQSNRLTARKGLGLLPKVLGVPVYLETRIVEIMGARRVTGVRMINTVGVTENLQCDGLVFTGQFTPESTLLQMGHLEVDRHSGGPVVDQFGRCSDPVYFATGNLLRPVETAGWCWKEGVHTAHYVTMSLTGQLCDIDQRTPITFNSPAIRYIMPQFFSASTCNHRRKGMKHLQMRFLTPANGCLSLHSGSQEVCSKSIRALPERRILLPLTTLSNLSQPETLKVEFNKTG